MSKAGRRGGEGEVNNNPKPGVGWRTPIVTLKTPDDDSFTPLRTSRATRVKESTPFKIRRNDGIAPRTSSRSTCNVYMTPLTTMKVFVAERITPVRTIRPARKPENTPYVTYRVYLDGKITPLRTVRPIHIAENARLGTFNVSGNYEFAPLTTSRAPGNAENAPLRTFEALGKDAVTPLQALRRKTCKRRIRRVRICKNPGNAVMAPLKPSRRLANRYSAPSKLLRTSRKVGTFPGRNEILETPGNSDMPPRRAWKTTGDEFRPFTIYQTLRRACHLEFARPFRLSTLPNTPAGLVNDMPRTPFPYVEINVGIVSPIRSRKRRVTTCNRCKRSLPLVLPDPPSCFSSEDSEADEGSGFES